MAIDWSWHSSMPLLIVMGDLMKAWVIAAIIIDAVLLIGILVLVLHS